MENTKIDVIVVKIILLSSQLSKDRNQTLQNPVPRGCRTLSTAICKWRSESRGEETKQHASQHSSLLHVFYSEYRPSCFSLGWQKFALHRGARRCLKRTYMYVIWALHTHSRQPTHIHSIHSQSLHSYLRESTPSSVIIPRGPKSISTMMMMMMMTPPPVVCQKMLANSPFYEMLMRLARVDRFLRRARQHKNAQKCNWAGCCCCWWLGGVNEKLITCPLSQTVEMNFLRRARPAAHLCSRFGPSSFGSG